MAKTSPTKFTKGTSGNPNGRPKGSKNASTLLKEALQGKWATIVGAEMPKVFKLMVKEALGYKKKIKVTVKGKDGLPDTEEWKEIEVEPDKNMQQYLVNKFMANAGSAEADKGKQAVTAIHISVTKSGEATAEGRTYEADPAEGQ